MPAAAKMALPDRAAFFERYRTLTPYVGRTIETLERKAVKLDKRGKLNGEDRDARFSTWPQPLDLEALAERDPETPRFIIPDWCRSASGAHRWAWGRRENRDRPISRRVHGAGGTFFGLDVGRRRVLYLSCEDREGILHWRLSRICRHLASTSRARRRLQVSISWGMTLSCGSATRYRPP